MAPRYKSQRARTLLISRITLVVLVVFIVLLGKAVWNVYTKARDTEQALAIVEKEHTELVARSDFLDREVRRLATVYGVEEEARERFGMAREGEQVFVIVEPDNDEATSTDKTLWGRFIGTLLFWKE